MRARLKWAGAAGLLVASAIWANAAFGQPTIDMSVVPAFDGHVKEGRWFPVTAVISNTGPRVRGSLEVTTEGNGRHTTFSTPVDLPRGSRLAYTLHILNEGLAGNVRVRLRLQGRRPLDRKVPIRSHPREDRIVVLIGVRPSSPIALAGLRVSSVQPRARPAAGASGQLQVAATTPAVGTVAVALHATDQASIAGTGGLPTRVQAYHSVDAVVLPGFQPKRVSSEEIDALRRWVASGGTLVVSAGGSVQSLKGSFVEKMLPVTLQREGTISSLGGLARRYGIATPPSGPVLVARAVRRSGTVLASQDGVPLVVEGRYDLGRVYFLAFDVNRQPARSWAEGMTELWREILTAPPTTWRLAENAWTADADPWGSMTVYGQPSSGARTLADAVRWIPQMEVPSFAFVGAFLVLYVLFLVPINYFVLKALDKRELSWITTPVIVIVFSIGAYMVGRSVKGGKVLVTQAAVVQARPGAGTAVVDDFIGIFSPSRTRYQAAMKDRHATLTEVVANPNAAAPSRLFVVEKDTVAAPALHVDMWDMKVLHSQGLLDLGKGIVAEAHLTPDGTIEGRIRNNTPYALQRCCVVRGPSSAIIGDVPSQGSARFTVLLSDLTKGDPGRQGKQLLLGGGVTGAESAVQREIKTQAANALLGAGQQLLGRTPADELLVVGWIADARRDIISLKPGSDDEAHAAVLALRMPIRVTGSTFDIAASLTRATIRRAAPNANVSYEEDGTIQLASGWFEADVRLPISGRDVIADSMTVHCARKGGKVRLYAWHEPRSQWQALDLKSGKKTAEVPEPQSFLRLPEGTVRLRVANVGGGDEARIATLGVEVQGRRR